MLIYRANAIKGIELSSELRFSLSIKNKSRKADGFYLLIKERIPVTDKLK